MDALLQPIWDAMRELDRDNIHRLVLKGPPPAKGTPLIYLPAVAARCSDHARQFDHLVIETPPLWQAELYGCIKNLDVTLDPSQYVNGYRMTLGLVSLPEEVSGLSRRAIQRELHCAEGDAVGSALPVAPAAPTDADADVAQEEKEASAAAAAPSRASSAADRIYAVFEYLELQWRRWQNPEAAPAAPLPPPIIDRKLYMHNLSPADLRQGASALDSQDEGEPDDDADPSSFFHGPSRCKSALCQDLFKHDSRSLYDLLPDASSCPGIFESLLYCKDGVVSFPLHGEQLGLRFSHHQLSGDTLWIVLQAGQDDKLRELAYRMAVARGHHLDKSIQIDDSKWTEGQKRNSRDMAWILFRAKALMPPLSLLNELGIRWRAEFVQAGRIITGDGDACHMGLSISDAQTVSFATNQLDHDYLEYGPATVLRHMEWVERLQRLHASGHLGEWLKHFSIPDDWLRLALNYAPPPLTCVLFTALRRDLLNDKSPHHEEYPRLYTVEHLEQLHNKNGTCAQIVSKLHAAKGLLEAHYRDVEEGGRNFALCSHAEAEA